MERGARLLGDVAKREVLGGGSLNLPASCPCLVLQLPSSAGTARRGGVWLGGDPRSRGGPPCPTLPTSPFVPLDPREQAGSSPTGRGSRRRSRRAELRPRPTRGPRPPRPLPAVPAPAPRRPPPRGQCGRRVRAAAAAAAGPGCHGDRRQPPPQQGRPQRQRQRQRQPRLGSARLSVRVNTAAAGRERARPGGLSMEDGFSSYSSLYDTSSLLQFCNGEGGGAGEAAGSGRRAARDPAEGQARRPRARPRQVAPVPARRRIVLGPRGRASPRAPGSPPVRATPGSPGEPRPASGARESGSSRGPRGTAAVRGRVARLRPNSHLFGPRWMLNSDNKTLGRGCAQGVQQLDPRTIQATLMKSSWLMQ